MAAFLLRARDALRPKTMFVPWRSSNGAFARGSQALLARDTYLFTGDHLWANEEETGLEAGREVCWFSWAAQRRSVARLAEHGFRWVLPGHGRRFVASSTAAMRDVVLRVAATM